MNTHRPLLALALFLALGTSTASACGSCRMTSLPAPSPDPVIVSVTTGDTAEPVAAAIGTSTAAIIAEANGRWQADLPLPRIAPSHTLHDSQGRPYQILMGSILSGPEGAVKDRDLVQRLLAALGQPS